MDGPPPQRPGYLDTVLSAGTDGIMNRQSAEQVETLLRQRFPSADVSVTRQPGGLLIEVYADASSLHAITGDEHSIVLAVLGATPEPPA